MKLIPMLVLIVLISSCTTNKGITYHGIDYEIEVAINDLKALQENTDKTEKEKDPDRDTLIKNLESTTGTSANNDLGNSRAIAAIIVKLKALQVDAVKSDEVKKTERDALIVELELIVADETEGNVADVAIATIIKELKELLKNTELTVAEKESKRRELAKKLEATKVLNREIMGNLIEAERKKSNVVWFEPKMAVNIRYFKDTGKDTAGEIDVFSDGRSLIALTGVLDVIRIRRSSWPVDIGMNVGIGVGAANIIEDAENKTAAALLGTIGIFIDFFKNNKSTNVGGLEFGVAHGYTFEESFADGDNDDSAWYIGYTYKFTF